MKDGKFETQAEIYQALLSGVKIYNRHWNTTKYVELKNGMLINDDAEQRSFYFQDPPNWSIYQEPKTSEKVKIVAHLARDGAVYLCDEGSNDCQTRDKCGCKRLSLSFDAEVIV